MDIRDITLRFGGVRALDGVSFNVAQGDIHAIIGPNGAGKTSLLNCISGLYRPQVGEIVFHSGQERGDRNLVRTKPGAIARLGVARTFQNIELFRHMTVLENLMLGRHAHMRHNLLTSFSVLRPGAAAGDPGSGAGGGGHRPARDPVGPQQGGRGAGLRLPEAGRARPGAVHAAGRCSSSTSRWPA